MQHPLSLRFLCLLTGLLCSAIPILGQQTIAFKTGNFTLDPVEPNTRNTDHQYLFYQADHTLTTQQKKALKDSGIEILYALQNHLYWVRVTKPQISPVNEHLFEINPNFKVGIDLDSRSGDKRYRISIAPGMSKEEINDWALQHDITLLDARAMNYGMIDVELSLQNLEPLLSTPWISYISTIPQDEEINYRGHHGERGWALTSPLKRGLDGIGITIGIGDGGRLGLHDDLSRDIIDLSSFNQSNHATQVTGIITGKGLIDPYFGSGYAPNANVIIRNFSDILLDAPPYITDFGLSITNNSYGAALGNCTYMGDYDGTSAFLDAMIVAHPQLLHVFSAGNSGQLTCAPYTLGYATIAGGYQPSKNLLTVGANNNIDNIAVFSSRGPVEDGRLKPEVVAHGVERFSTINNHQYSSNNGTSFSSPATAGVATLLYQRYRQFHSDSLPDAALIKNVICNAADDLGNTGPDFLYGFGKINGDRAASILESEQYVSMVIDHGEVMTTSFSIPSGVAFADVMLMWTDPASAPFETVTLVNDLDIAVVTPTGDTIKPWILNYTPSGVSLAATKGADHTNNYEQVTIPTPISGTYTIVVKGYQIPMGPQKAWISWDIHLSGITVQSPIGGEVYKPGNGSVANDRQYVRWDAYGTGSSTFTVQYSTNGGSTWSTIASGLAANRRWMDWFPPNLTTEQLLVRVTASNGMEDVSDTTAIIMAAPASLTAFSPCDGYVQLSWNAVAGADYYQLYTIKNEVLTAIDTSIGTSKVLSDFPVDSSVWVAVSGVFSSGSYGLRSRAIPVTANGGNACAWDHDLRVDSLIGLSTGRLHTTTELSSTATLTLRVANGGTQRAYDITLAYSINNAPAVEEVFTDTLEADAMLDFSFVQTADLSAPGTYVIKAWTTYNDDLFHQNDTTTLVIRQLTNADITLPWTETFESIPDTTFISTGIGPTGFAAWDILLEPNARLRTFAGLPFCHSGERAWTVDAIRSGSNKEGDLILTLNFDAYTIAEDDIRLSLYVMHHEIIPEVTNNEAIWIRGSDSDPFVLLTTISNDAYLRGQWQHLSGLQISSVLEEASQDFSGSFQIRFTHGVYATAGQLTSQDGQTIDDISLHLVTGDITIDEIIHPASQACNLGIDTIKINVVNTTTLDVSDAYAYYQLNGGTVHQTFIDTIHSDSSIILSLLPPADFSATGMYTLKVWVTSIDDDFIFNDTSEITILHTPLIDTFPYTEGFETGEGGWMTDGIRSSWAHGVPGKQTISRGAEGNKVWTTSLNSTHNADEASYLYSPCFDIRTLEQPFLSFAFQYQLEEDFDYAWVEYRVENSMVWTKLGTQISGVNWYNDNTDTWNGSQPEWITTGYPIPVTDTTIQFRWVMQSDVGVEFEGLAIDQVHLYDLQNIYPGDEMEWTIPVSGDDWIHVVEAGERVLSIHPSGQDLGDVTITVFKSEDDFQLTDSLYLLSRNWVITSTIPPSGPIKLRGYFTSTEADHLVNAVGCAQCIAARDGFDFAVLRYTGTNEDGIFSNNNNGNTISYATDSTAILPYDDGYYAEWQTTGFSEWWITTSVTKWSGDLERRVSSSYDDAEEHENNGAVNPIRSSLALTDRDGHQKVGWRFKNITIPYASYISSAHIEWISADTSTSSADWTLQTEMVADALSFTTSKYNLSLRPRSAQVVQWMPEEWSSINATYSSPDIRHLIQGIVDQPGWINGNDMVLLMKGDGWREAWSYDGDPLKSAKLVITYDSICLSSGIIYVDHQATGLQDGSSWTHAYKSLEQALDRATHCPDITQIWVAGGTYTPYVEAGRSAWYAVPQNISIYGGFEGTETSIEERVLNSFPTVLSGDVGTPGVTNDNLYRVLHILPGSGEVLLDGLTIRDGLANGSLLDLQRGSGLYIQGNLKTNQVFILDCSAPSVYTFPGTLLTNTGVLEIKQ